MASLQRGFLESISPWPSRSSTPKPADQGKTADKSPAPPPLEKSKGDDHTVTQRHRLSLKDYPQDCPRANIRWFYGM